MNLTAPPPHPDPVDELVVLRETIQTLKRQTGWMDLWACRDTHSLSLALAGWDPGSTSQTSSICWAVRTGVVSGRHAVGTWPYRGGVRAFLERSRISERDPQQAAHSKESLSLAPRFRGKSERRRRSNTVILSEPQEKKPFGSRELSRQLCLPLVTGS